MCGRYSLSSDSERVGRRFGVEQMPLFPPRFNIAPSQAAPVIFADRDKPAAAAGHPGRCRLMQWGLVPHWAKDVSIGRRLINARAETAADKPAFRAAMRYRRAVVPANGFYEWQGKGSARRPMYIRISDEEMFALGGLWECWQSPDGSELETFAILTTAANERMATVHDRMPLILPHEAEARWLDPAVQKPDEVADLLVPFPAARMELWPVSTRVNSPKHDDASLIEPAELF